MLSETIERINHLRQQALLNPEFTQSARAHQKALEAQTQVYNPARKRKAGRKAQSKKAQSKKALADIYQQVDFSINPTGTEH